MADGVRTLDVGEIQRTLRTLREGWLQRRDQRRQGWARVESWLTTHLVQPVRDNAAGFILVNTDQATPHFIRDTSNAVVRQTENGGAREVQFVLPYFIEDGYVFDFHYRVTVRAVAGGEFAMVQERTDGANGGLKEVGTEQFDADGDRQNDDLVFDFIVELLGEFENFMAEIQPAT